MSSLKRTKDQEFSIVTSLVTERTPEQIAATTVPTPTLKPVAGNRRERRAQHAAIRRSAKRARHG